jgi:hypothetical protein
MACVILNLISLLCLSGREPLDLKPLDMFSELGKMGHTITEADLEIIFADSLLQSNTQGIFYKLNDTSLYAQIKYVYIGRVNSCRTGGCSASSTPVLNVQNESESEYFDYYIFFDAKPSVLKVKVFNYMASHGQEITSKGWLKQFISYDGRTSLRVGKDIDAISGATISVYAICLDVETRSASLSTYCNKVSMVEF